MYLKMPLGIWSLPGSLSPESKLSPAGRGDREGLPKRGEEFGHLSSWINELSTVFLVSALFFNPLSLPLR